MKNKFFVLVLAGLTLSACGVSKTNPEMGNKEESPKTESAKSLKDLLGLGASQRCTYEVNNNGEIMKGEMLVDGKKFKQTTEITNQDGTMKVYAISDGDYYYSWNEAMKGKGTKMKITDFEDDTSAVDENEDETVEMEASQQIDMNEKIDYKCSPATLKDSDLAIPTDVEFIDYSEMMNGLQNMDLEQLQKFAPQE